MFEDMFDTAIYEVEAPGQVRVEHGPISMRIRAEQGGSAHTQAALQGGHSAVAILDELARYQHFAKMEIGLIRVDPSFPEVLNRMIIAAKITGDSTVTPMVAVAGTISELVAETAESAGASTLYIENGGDIALMVEPGRTLRIGIAQDLNTKQISHVIIVDNSSGIRGICTSGLGGRSFTKGVATAAVAIGKSASIADACATLIGNATLIDDPAVEQDLADKKDPLTDIVGHLVTTRVGRLSEESVAKALAQGIAKGREFIDRGLLEGVVVVVQGEIRMFPQNIAIARSNGT